ncbi:MAG: LPS-assembly protein LptD, partial [Rikenellaceae bacterium]|nr:LPS-assembly protein LptD [Rikenellaceae bacterium]
MKHFRLKYLVLLVVAFAVAHIALVSATPRPLAEQIPEQVRKGDSLAPIVAPTVGDSTTQRESRNLRRSRRSRRLTDSVATPLRDTVAKSDTLAIKPLSQRDTTARKKKSGSLIEQIINGKNSDSLYYDVRNKRVYIYNQGDIKYDNMGLQADYMQIDMTTKEIYAYGKADSVEGKPKNTHPVFSEGGSSYTMDTITYNFGSKKAFIQGV